MVCFFWICGSKSYNDVDNDKQKQQKITRVSSLDIKSKPIIILETPEETANREFQFCLFHARQNSRRSFQKLGWHYLSGNGTRKDERLAFFWFLKSAQDGNKYSQYSVVWCYRNGIGTTKDIHEVFKWYRKIRVKWNIRMDPMDIFFG
ncbi:7175_t:CDS:1 [Ambispora gerdemannii]|uniref:7175_t:CDS:1 n=1 Tax=Ambispora gerdemannii TaxID=144530 RepID=A0A9N8ZKD7_9GLOM|nr:7175_t:CDS:1 [Ambispora gerdemannii]